MVYLKFQRNTDETLKGYKEYEREYDTLKEAMEEALSIQMQDDYNVAEILTDDSIYTREEIKKYWLEKQWIREE